MSLKCFVCDKCYIQYLLTGVIDNTATYDDILIAVCMDSELSGSSGSVERSRVMCSFNANMDVICFYFYCFLFCFSCAKSGHMRGSLVTLQKLVHLFPDDTSLKNDLGVGYLLIGDNENAKKVYEEVSEQQSSINYIKLF